MTKFAVPTVQQLLASGPGRVQAWLDSHINDSNLAREFNWHGLAEAVVRKSRIEMDTDWAATAIRVYEHWASLMGGTAYESSRLSTMFLRAFFIKHLGPEAGDPVRDIQLLVAAFEDGLIYSIREAEELTVGWEKLEIGKIRELRLIKDRLAPFKLLDIQLLDLFPHIKEWLAMRDRLP